MLNATSERKRGAPRKPRQIIDITALIADAQRAYDALIARRAARERASTRHKRGRPKGQPKPARV